MTGVVGLAGPAGVASLEASWGGGVLAGVGGFETAAGTGGLASMGGGGRHGSSNLGGTKLCEAVGGGGTKVCEAVGGGGGSGAAKQGTNWQTSISGSAVREALGGGGGGASNASIEKPWTRRLGTTSISMFITALSEVPIIITSHLDIRHPSRAPALRHHIRKGLRLQKVPSPTSEKFTKVPGQECHPPTLTFGSSLP